MLKNKSHPKADGPGWLYGERFHKRGQLLYPELADDLFEVFR